MRPTTPLTLPVSGFAVELATYYTKGEDDAINAYGLQGAEVVTVPDPATGDDRLTLQHIPVDRYRREVLKLLELGIKSATRDGESVPVGFDFIAELPTKDVALLTEKLITVRSGDGDPKAPTPASTT